MPTLQVTIDGETHEADLSDVTLPENHELISPDNANSKGYYTEKQHEQKIQNRLATRDKNIKKDLIDDEEWLQKAASRTWGISFDEEGEPQGLKPEVDVDQVRQNAVESVKEKYENEIEDISSKATMLKSKLIEQSILSATKGAWKEEYTKHQDNGRVKPIAVNQFKNLFDLTDDGQVALKDSSDDGFHPSPDGGYVTPDEYLTNRDKFGDYMVDTRIKGSGFQKGGHENGKQIYTEKQIDAMSEKEFAENEDEIMKAMSEGRIKKN